MRAEAADIATEKAIRESNRLVRVNAVRRQLERGLSVRTVALEMNVSPTTVQYWKLIAGIPVECLAARGEDHARARLTEDDVREMRFLHSQPGITLRGIADYFGVSKGCVIEVVSRRTWRHVR